MSIRVAGAEDLAAILALQRKYPAVVTWNDTVWSGLLDAVGMPLRRVWLAESTGQVVGFAVLGIAADVGEFEMLLVEESARGKGLGRALCQTAMQWAAGNSVRRFELEVRESNAAARGIYASLGFVVQGVRPRYYHHPTEDAVLMGLML
jgi:ribosomal-protein-alanine N-acetyltransferase